MGTLKIEIVIVFDIDEYIYILISKPRELDKMFIDLIELLRLGFPQIECRFSGSYFKLFSKDYKALFEVTQTIFEIICNISINDHE